MSNAREFLDPVDPLVSQALQYVTGRIDAREAAAFEQRLGEDQRVREAVVRAVEMTAPQAPWERSRPDPAYRTRVRQALQSTRPMSHHRETRRRNHRHILGLCFLGGFGAALLVLGLTLHFSPLGSREGNPLAKATNPAHGGLGASSSRHTALPNAPRYRRWGHRAYARPMIIAAPHPHPHPIPQMRLERRTKVRCRWESPQESRSRQTPQSQEPFKG